MLIENGPSLHCPICARQHIMTLVAGGLYLCDYTDTLLRPMAVHDDTLHVVTEDEEAALAATTLQAVALERHIARLAREVVTLQAPLLAAETTTSSIDSGVAGRRTRARIPEAPTFRDYRDACDRIEPLMLQISDICRAAGVPFVMVFERESDVANNHLSCGVSCYSDAGSSSLIKRLTEEIFRRINQPSTEIKSGDISRSDPKTR